MITNFKLYEKLSTTPEIGLYIIFRPMEDTSHAPFRKRYLELLYDKIGLIIGSKDRDIGIGWEILYDAITDDDIKTKQLSAIFHHPQYMAGWANLWAIDIDDMDITKNSFMSGDKKELETILKGDRFDL